MIQRMQRLVPSIVSAVGGIRNHLRIIGGCAKIVVAVRIGYSSGFHKPASVGSSPTAAFDFSLCALLKNI